MKGSRPPREESGGRRPSGTSSRTRLTWDISASEKSSPPDEVEESEGKPVRYRYGGTWGTALRYQYGKTIHRCEPLVDAAVWKHANEALSSRPKRGHTDPRDRAMLAEAIFCPACADSPMYRLKTTGALTRDLFYYRCAGRGSQRQGCGNMVRVELVDAAVNVTNYATRNQKMYVNATHKSRAMRQRGAAAKAQAADPQEP